MPPPVLEGDLLRVEVERDGPCLDELDTFTLADRSEWDCDVVRRVDAAEPLRHHSRVPQPRLVGDQCDLDASLDVFARSAQ